MKLTYLIGISIYTLFWLFLFIRLPEKHRKNVLISSIGFGIGGMIEAGVFMANDWFAPERLFGWSVGIEDFISGISMGGISIMMGQETILRLKKQSFPQIKIGGYIILVYLFIFYTVRFILIHAFGMDSFNSFLIVSISTFLLTIILLPNVFIDLLKCGLLVAGLTFIQFQLFDWADPEFVTNAWNWSAMPYKQQLFGWPIVDIIWAGLIVIFLRSLRLFWAATIEY